MFEAYKIGISIGVMDATRGSILKIAAQFGKANKEASAFLATLHAVNAELRRPSSWAGAAANDFRNARREAEGYARAARSSATGRGGGAASTGMVFAGAAAYGGGALSRMSRRGNYPLALSGPASSGGGAIIINASRGGRMAGWGMPAFGRGGGSGGGGGGSGGGLGGGMGRMFGGMMLEQAGKAELGMLSGPINAASEYQAAVARFQVLGLGDALNKDAIKFANSMNIVGTSMTQAVDFMTEAQGVFRESGLKGPAALEGAKLAAPFLAKIAYATSGLDGESQARMHTQSLDMLRFVEMRGGLSSPAKFNSLAEQGWKAIRSSGGNVNWSQLRQFMSTGSVAAQGLTNTALFGELEPIIGELKGGGAGHAFMTAYSRVNGLQRLIPRIMQREMMRLNLWDASKIQLNSAGGIKSFDGNPLINANLFSSSPYQYYRDVVKPAYLASGITKPQDTYRENAILFGNTGGKFFSIMDRQMANIAMSVAAQAKAFTVEKSGKEVDKTLAGQLLQYQAEMNTLLTKIGVVILPTVIKGLRWLTPILQQAANWIGQHSTLTKGLVIVFGAIGALALVAGSVLAIGGALGMITGALGGGALAAGLGGLAAALGPLAALAAVYVGAKMVGGAIYKHAIAGTSYGDAIGGTATNIMAFLGSKDAQETQARMQRFNATQGRAAMVGSRNGGHGMIHTTVNIDGRRVAEAITPHQTRAATRAQTGMSGFDATQFAIPIGAH